MILIKSIDGAVPTLSFLIVGEQAVSPTKVDTKFYRGDVNNKGPGGCFKKNLGMKQIHVCGCIENPKESKLLVFVK